MFYKIRMSEGAQTELIDQIEQLISTYQDAVRSEAKLKQLYQLEMFRSHVLDIEDDISGKSCTETTLKRIEIVQAQIAQNFKRLKLDGALFHGNANQTKQALIESYQHKLILAKSYQV
jgi:pentose-5-phosphate-3-epimerase